MALPARSECHANISPILGDDMLIFTNARILSLQCLRHHMVHYEESSGQKINLEKSVFHPSKLISSSRLVWIKTDFGLFEEESTIQISRRPYL